MSTIRQAPSSSLYSESPNSLAKQVERGVEADDPNATIMTWTEVGSPERTAVLKNASPDWAAWVPDASDVGIMWRKAQWQPRWKEPHKLTDKVWTDGQGRKHETYCATALLDHSDGHSAFISVCHLPSHVDNAGKFYDNAQAKAWKSAVQGWSDYWNAKRKKDHPDLCVLAADWNVDLHLSNWRQYLGDVYPSMHLCWAGDKMPSGGTHGGRLIDATYSTGKITKAKLLMDDSSSDHRPYGCAIVWP